MTASKIALFALAASVLASVQPVHAAPFGDQGSHYVQTRAGAVETGTDQAKGDIR
ncbi:hypothetical protein PQJ75_03530 [Rhodoplanes sp. TEM]|uniref:Uncharacterized protein n=1 Tax=Rhodoplanes tepidamans TaxID=200616 RepID=A0ABT5J8Z1_RHOTP|nr:MULTISPECIES: hypothetical protein [Rhodoplanes]MDC7786122.1 hypothetical protein [Rhodoplanes tepidamans]MDC7982789.1 hypothetical protein [Rhodoplanes sp. TEM]MDQ0357213.1 hypothetical protein [Rhodoplanes tepidamans]